MNNTNNTSGLCKWRKASENPIPEGYVGVIRNLHPLGVYQYTRWDKDYPGVNATAEWLEELPTPETTEQQNPELLRAQGLYTKEEMLAYAKKIASDVWDASEAACNDGPYGFQNNKAKSKFFSTLTDLSIPMYTAGR